MSRLKAFASYLVPSLAALGILVAGVLLGHWVTLRPFAARIAERERAFTTGRVFVGQDRQVAREAYLDPEAAGRELDDWSWAVPNVPAPFLGSLPRSGHWFNATINEGGFRHERPIAVPKPAGLVRVFVTGGSTAYGAGAPDRDRTIGGYLERLLNDELASVGRRYEVIVAANQAWATTQERILIENRLAELEPDLVISFSGNNDVHWARLGRDVMWFRTYADEHWYRIVDRIYRAAGDGPLPDPTATPGPPVAPALVARRLERNVRLASHTLQLVGARYLFALQPTFNLTTKPLAPGEQRIYDGLHDGLRDYFRAAYGELRVRLDGVESANFTFVDLSDAFAGQPASDQIFLDQYHWGDRGNELVARALLEALRPLLFGEAADGASTPEPIAHAAERSGAPTGSRRGQ